jgi:hypothetical protein
VPGSNPAAASVIVVGEEYEGQVVSVRESFCFIQISEVGKEYHDVFYFFGSEGVAPKVGQICRLILGENFDKKNNIFKSAAEEVKWMK